ncbi:MULTISPECIES: outer membrane protein assembly factor BamC [Paraburkholderia]|uniref:Beta-barrel assembly machine subunit BamC n=2 Tax=Paraburkholderia TaxID=1822464 RepID=A0A7Z7B231_9BURK|nr:MULTISPECIES: outer membrane protein assembly factor BamC [Paraburkholderia]AUT59079.1 outer membrane protein assembly factor BamC [Paraburkholderia terrae]BCZ77359.1 lipoprotein [Paraburkholderia terrae]SDG95181.1 Beta-barrel assembly machine subunit BamC [Paraburkholderia steynii]
MTELRLTKRFAALLMAGGLVAGCGTSSPNKIDYKSDSKSKEVSLAVPPNMLEETADQRSLPPQSGQTSLSTLQQVQSDAPTAAVVAPAVSGMHIQRDGTESWLVLDNQSPDKAWPQIRRFWQEQGFLLVVDQRDKGVMETDWNETHPSINDGLIRSTLSKAMGNSYVTAERNKYRTRLEAAPNGGTYVFISQKGLREALSGANNDTSKWEPKPNDPALETEYLKRLMATLAKNDTGTRTANAAADVSPAGSQTPPNAAAGGAKSAAAATAAQNVALAGQTPVRDPSSADTSAQFSSTELTLGEPYDRAWLRVGLALDRSNFTVDDRDLTRGIYFVRYVDPKDMTSAEQGFWSQVFHGRKEKVAKQYRVNVRAVTPNQTRVAVVDDKGDVDSSPQAKQIMSLMVDQLH